MSKSDTWETGLLKLLFQNIAFTGVGDAGGLLPSATAGNLYLSLHTADPGEAGDQTTNEVSYGSYARQAIARSTSGFTVTGNSVSPAADVSFPKGTSGALSSALYLGIGTALSGAGKLLYSGPLASPIPFGLNVTPQVLATSALTED